MIQSPVEGIHEKVKSWNERKSMLPVQEGLSIPKSMNGETVE